VYTIKTTTTVTVTNNAEGIKVKLLKNCKGWFQLNEKYYMHGGFQGVYK